MRVHTRNTQVDDDFKRAVADKLSRAARIFGATGDVDVELMEEHNPRRVGDRYRIEVTGTAAGRTMRITTAAETPEAALDAAVDRFGRQLKKLKERLIDRARKPGGEEAGETTGEGELEIVRVKQFVMKPMTVEEAAQQLEILGHDFYFFLNRATDRQTVLYRRRDGRLGMIEPA